CVCATSVLLHASAAPTRTTLASFLRLDVVCIPEKQNCAQLFSSFYRLCGKNSDTCRIGPVHAEGNAWGHESARTLQKRVKTYRIGIGVAYGRTHALATLFA